MAGHRQRDPRFAPRAGRGNRARRLAQHRAAAARPLAGAAAHGGAALRPRQSPPTIACLHEGLKAIPRKRRQNPAAPALAIQLEAITAAATTGLKDHDRWRGANILLSRKLANRRSTSQLGDLLDYVIFRPLVSAEMIAKQLCISTTAARDLVRTFDLHEMTGRQRYRVWSIL